MNSETVFEIPANFDMELRNKTYSADFFCTNCHKHNKRLVKKGVKLNGLFITCENCGCAVEGKTTIL